MVRLQPEFIAAGRPERKKPVPIWQPGRGSCAVVGVGLAARETPAGCLKRIKEAFTLHASASRARGRNFR